MDLSELLTLHNVMVVNDTPEYQEPPYVPDPIASYVDIRDLVRVKKIVTNEITEEDTEYWDKIIVAEGYPPRTYIYYDIDRDGSVTASDLTLIRKILLGVLEVDELETWESGHLSYVGGTT